MLETRARVATLSIRAVARLDVEAHLVDIVAAAPTHTKIRSTSATSHCRLPTLACFNFKIIIETVIISILNLVLEACGNFDNKVNKIDEIKYFSSFNS